jgi:hypothetical protein
MMKLREKLRQKAEIELAGLVSETSALEGLHPAVTGEEIAQLAFGKRTATLKKAVIGRMIAHDEEEITEKFSEQFDLTWDDKDKESL